MGKRILVPMDDSAMAERALEYALETFPDGDITVMHVVGVPSPFMSEAVSVALEGDIEEAGERKAEGVFERAQTIAGERDVDTLVRFGSPTKAIAKAAESFDGVVVGSHGGDFSDRVLVGNVAEAVVRRSPVPVTVVR